MDISRKERLEREPIKDIRQAIKAFCLAECMMGQKEEVKLCPSKWCPLYPYRFGTNPFNKKNLTEEQRKALAERLYKSRQNKKKEKKEN